MRSEVKAFGTALMMLLINLLNVPLLTASIVSFINALG
jgi:hypothetical protein